MVIIGYVPSVASMLSGVISMVMFLDSALIPMMIPSTNVASVRPVCVRTVARVVITVTRSTVTTIILFVIVHASTASCVTTVRSPFGKMSKATESDNTMPSTSDSDVGCDAYVTCIRTVRVRRHSKGHEHEKTMKPLRKWTDWRGLQMDSSNQPKERLGRRMQE